MTSNNNGKHKLEEEDAESSTMRKRLRPFDVDGGDNDDSNSTEEEMEEEEEEEKEVEEEVSSEEMSMNQLDTSEEKLYARRACDMLFSDDGSTPSTLLEPSTPKVIGAPTRRATMKTTMMMTTSECR
jgi:hypothetical protein